MTKLTTKLTIAAMMFKAMDPRSIVEAPSKAFEFEASSLRFEAASEAQDSEKPFSMIARTGDPINHWYWGKVVHDLDGMVAKERVSVDWCHDCDDLVGYADSFDASSGDLKVGGKVISLKVGDSADKIIKLGSKGVPYEASIYFTDGKAEYLPDNMTTQVNGREIAGPCVIFREWTLRRIAICPSGADGGTETSLSAQDKELSLVSFSWKGEPMSKQLGDGELSTDKGSAPAAGPTSSGDAEAQFKASLKRYTDRFGMEKGAEYFSSNLSFEQALEKHVEQLSAERDSALTAKKEAETKLAAANLGEKEPIGSASLSNGKSASTSFDDNMKAAREKARAANK